MESQSLQAKALLADFNKIRHNNEQCMYAECTNKPIRSHTISKSSIRQLNTETIQLRVVNDNIFDLIKCFDDRIFFNECRISKVSTFYGFCSGHDTRLFKPVDQFDGTITNEIALLSHYRIICFGLDNIITQLKREELLRISQYSGPASKNTHEFLRKLNKGYFKRKLEMEQQVYLERKELCETILAKKEFHRVNCIGYDGSKNNPLVSGRCGAFFHGFSRNGQRGLLPRMPYITFTTLHNGDCTTLLFTMLDLDIEYYPDLLTFIDHKDLHKRLERLFFGHSDFCILNEPASGSMAEKAIKEIIHTDKSLII
jgi:hypothetical protein